MFRRKAVWVLVIALIATWGYRKLERDQVNAAAEYALEQQLSQEMSAKFKADTDKFMHGFYQSSICNFKKEVQPVEDMLEKISTRKAIPPDLIAEVKELNEAAQFLAIDDKLFKPDDGLSQEEQVIEDSVKNFAKKLKLKTAELEQGIILGTDPYFLQLSKNLEILVEPACKLYADNHDEELASPRPSVSPPRDTVFGNGDSTMANIGKKVAYDGLCKLSASSDLLSKAIEDAKTSPAFKSALLESTKSAIYDLSYAFLTFDGKLLYSPSPNESNLVAKISGIKSNLESSRYSYWENGSNSALNSMMKSSSEMKQLGNAGCKESKNVDRK
jgi:hypothetical protein